MLRMQLLQYDWTKLVAVISNSGIVIGMITGVTVG